MEKVYLLFENMTFGNRVKLKSNMKLDKYSQWGVEDDFNGKSDYEGLQEPIYGFFSPLEKVNVILVRSDGTEEIFKNVTVTTGGDL